MEMQAAQWISYFSNWTFCYGTPTADWALKRRSGIVFHLDACQDLDKLLPAVQATPGDEGVLYADFETGPGSILLGFGCNWEMEIRCDGQPVFSSYGVGNGQTYVFPDNNRVSWTVSGGRHLLAVRVRRGEKHWNFACGYVPPQRREEPKITFGPWLSNPDAGTVTVGFACNMPLGACIWYRIKGTDTWQKQWHQRQGQCLRRTYHAVQLPDLQPGAVYQYRVVTIDPSSYLEVPLTEDIEFTVPDFQKDTYSFFFTADLQFNLQLQHELFGKMLQAADAASCDFFVLAGDVNSAFMPDKVIEGPFAQLCEYGAASKPILYIRGNHEMRGDYGDQFLDYFANAKGTTYDVVRLGDTAFLLLDSWEDKPAKTPGHRYCQWNLDDYFIRTESAWLEKALHSSRWLEARRHIVICHAAPYSQADGCRTIPYVLQNMTDRFFEGQQPPFELNLWLAGHVHKYLRSIPGTDMIAAEVQPPPPLKGGTSYSYPVLTVSGPGKTPSRCSCFRVDVTRDNIHVKAFNHNGELLEDIIYGNDKSCREIISLPKWNCPCK